MAEPRIRVVVDAMGSDRAPDPEVEGAIRTVRAHPIDVTLVGGAARIRVSAPAIDVAHATAVVTMHDHPGQAFRQKPDSSMRVAVARVAAGQGDALVSAGNSGVLFVF